MKQDESVLETGISFGLTSGVISTPGLMVGLHSGTHLRVIVISGILTRAIADAMSDALDIHVSEESKHSTPATQIWEATLEHSPQKFWSRRPLWSQLYSNVLCEWRLREIEQSPEWNKRIIGS